MATKENTHTILNIKTDKTLKAEAKEIAANMGVSLTTIVNAMLQQFVRDRELTLSDNELRPSAWLQKRMIEAQKEYEAGESKEFATMDDMIAHLKTL